jgi:hypothetical protein
LYFTDIPWRNWLLYHSPLPLQHPNNTFHLAKNVKQQLVTLCLITTCHIGNRMSMFIWLDRWLLPEPLAPVFLHSFPTTLLMTTVLHDGIDTGLRNRLCSFPLLHIVPHLVWKVWATPQVKFFAWLAIRNRIWTADRLERRVWENCGLCPLCKQTQETTAHLFSHCRYTKRLWVWSKIGPDSPPSILMNGQRTFLSMSGGP